MTSVISVIKSEYTDANINLKKALMNLTIPTLKEGDTVVIKINLCDARPPETGAITHPLFLDSLLQYFRKDFNNLNIYVVESDATVALASYFIKWFGFLPVLRKWEVEFINLSHTNTTIKKINGRHLKEIAVPKIIDEAQLFVTLAKPKTNPISTITCCLKNQFGCLPEVDKNIYHPYLDDVIADINRIMRPGLCIVDGIIAMGQTQGPAYGAPIPLRTIICSEDPVATDAFVARLMGFNPLFIGHIRKAAFSGIGSLKYKLIGDKLENTKNIFEISKLEVLFLQFALGQQNRSQKQFRSSRRRK
jgi:uncharacterized protein (DUF362 family)